LEREGWRRRVEREKVTGDGEGWRWGWKSRCCWWWGVAAGDGRRGVEGRRSVGFRRVVFFFFHGDG